MKREENKSFIKKIPGFRSGKAWKMIIATFFYIILILFITGLIVTLAGIQPTSIPSQSSTISQPQPQQLSVDEIKQMTINVTYDKSSSSYRRTSFPKVPTKLARAN